METKIMLPLTQRQAELLDSYIFKKLANLEASDLREADCYKELYQIHRCLQKYFKNLKK